MLGRGDTAPDFVVRGAEGDPFALSERLRQGPIVLYFYPLDYTFVCTRQACLFRDAHEEFTGLGASVIGVSTNDEASHEGFSARHGLPFPLVADPGKKICTAYDTVSLVGRWSKRVTFVIGQDMRIEHVFHHEWSAAKHIQGVRSALIDLEYAPECRPLARTHIAPAAA